MLQFIHCSDIFFIACCHAYIANYYFHHRWCYWCFFLSFQSCYYGSCSPCRLMSKKGRSQTLRGSPQLRRQGWNKEECSVHGSKVKMFKILKMKTLLALICLLCMIFLQTIPLKIVYQVHLKSHILRRATEYLLKPPWFWYPNPSKKHKITII